MVFSRTNIYNRHAQGRRAGSMEVIFCRRCEHVVSLSYQSDSQRSRCWECIWEHIEMGWNWILKASYSLVWWQSLILLHTSCCLVLSKNTHLNSFCQWSKVYCHHSTFPDKPPCGCHGFSIRRCVLHSSLLSSTRYYRSVPINPLGSVLNSSMSSIPLLPEWVHISVHNGSQVHKRWLRWGGGKSLHGKGTSE